MTPLFISVLLAAMCLGMNTTLAQKDNVLQAKGEETAAAGGTVTLGCQYNTSANYFFWYRQHPGKPPEFLISHSPSGSVGEEKIRGLKIHVEGKEIKMSISSAAVSDSAVYYCALPSRSSLRRDTETKIPAKWRCYSLSTDISECRRHNNENRCYVS
uniref:Ig-like domain-containing protein n=1 Tax=Astatotilapia calliptera TaxID=8154 RepID=A0A3P8QND0_ASTCA